MRDRLIALALVTILVGACSDGDDGDTASSSSTSSPRQAEETAEQPTGETEAVVDLLATQFASSDDPNRLQFDTEQAQCTAEGVVDRLGMERLQELGFEAGAAEVPQLSGDLLEPDEQDEVYAAITACVDLEDQLADLLLASGLTEDQATCVAEHYMATDLPQRSLMSAHDPELNAEIDATLAAAAEDCASAAD